MKAILSGKLGVVLPLVLGLLAALVAWQYLEHQKMLLGLRSQPVVVVVAKEDIPRMTKLQPGMVEEMTVPKSFAQPAAVPSKEQAYDQVTLVPIKKGEQLLANKLAGFGLETGLAIKVPRGLRAMSVDVEASTGVTGLITPGDYVDVLVALDFGDQDKSDKRAYTLMQDILVLAVDQYLGQESEAAALARGRGEPAAGPPGAGGAGRGAASRGVKNVTLGLTPVQAQDMLVMAESGRISLALRSMGEGHHKDPPRPSTVNTSLGIQEKPMQPKIGPNWREIRGTQAR